MLPSVDESSCERRGRCVQKRVTEAHQLLSCHSCLSSVIKSIHSWFLHKKKKGVKKCFFETWNRGYLTKCLPRWLNFLFFLEQGLCKQRVLFLSNKTRQWEKRHEKRGTKGVMRKSRLNQELAMMIKEEKREKNSIWSHTRHSYYYLFFHLPMGDWMRDWMADWRISKSWKWYAGFIWTVEPSIQGLFISSRLLWSKYM